MLFNIHPQHVKDAQPPDAIPFFHREHIRVKQGGNNGKQHENGNQKILEL
jgi:hypothetical protein